MSIISIVEKYDKLLSSHQKKRIIQLVILMVVGGVLETCSVGLIIPFIDALVNIDFIMSKWYVKTICDILRLHHPHTFLFVMAVSLGLLYVFKNIFLLVEYNAQYKFVYNNRAIIQSRVLDNIVNNPYEFFLNSNSSEVIRLVSTDVASVFDLLQQLLFMFTELVVSFMLIAAIFLIMPGTTLIIAFILLVLLIVINIVVKPILKREGEKTQIAAADMNKWLIQSIHGIKEVKVMGKEEYFVDCFWRGSKMLASCRRKQSVLTYVPKFIIEAVCMASLFFVIAVLIITGSRFNEIMPMLSAVAMASIRLLPSVNRISSALSNIAYYEPMLDNVLSNMSIIEVTVENSQEDSSNKKSEENNQIIEKDTDENCKAMSLNSIDFHEITYHYPGRGTNVLEEASMVIREGEAVGVVGNSGAGKTTVVDIMLGLIVPQKGQVLIDGRDIQDNLQRWHASIGYIPQMIFMMDGTVRDNVIFGRKGLKDDTDARIWKALDEAALGEFIRELPNGLDTEIGERGIRLSGGQRQRIGIARALYSEPDILVFDEATSALDNKTEAEIMKSVYELQGSKTMIIIAHRLTTIDRCDHVYRVENKKIIRER